MMTLDECIKYVESHLEVRPAKRNGAYKSGRKITPQGCVNHSLGVAQPSVDAIYSNMNHESAQWGVNAILGDFDRGDGRIILALDWDTRPWGCGLGSKGSYNNSRIQWEVCEPAGHTYNGGTMIGYNVEKNKLYFDRMWKMLVAWNVYCAKRFGYPVSCICDHSESYKSGYGTNHADMMQWLPKHGKSMDKLRSEVEAILDGAVSNKEDLNRLQGVDLSGLSEKEVVDKVGPLFTAEHKRSGILASVIFAQWILESGYGSTELAKKGNNFFGMKETLSGNTWSGSTWDGKSTVTINTKECYNGNWVTIAAKFRKYPSVRESIEDHSAYLLGAMNGPSPRYEGLKGCKNYKKAAKIIKAGGYATDPNYVDKLVDIIGRWNLTKYDYTGEVDPKPVPTPNTSYPETPFGVKVAVNDLPIITDPFGIKIDIVGETGIGVFTIVKVKEGFGLLKSYESLENGWIDLKDSTKCKILDTIPPDQKSSDEVPFMVHVNTNGLRIRRGPSMYSEFTGMYTGIGTFTIVEVQDGHGSESGWGLLKSYKKKRDGWIALDYSEKV